MYIVCFYQKPKTVLGSIFQAPDFVEFFQSWEGLDTYLDINKAEFTYRQVINNREITYFTNLYGALIRVTEYEETVSTAIDTSLM